MIALIIVLVNEKVLSRQADPQLQTRSSNCSYWSHYNRVTQTCDCGRNIYDIVSCEPTGVPTEVQVHVSYGYCMTLNNHREKAVVGACPYHYHHCLPPCTYEPVSRNLSSDFCQNQKRTGQLCGQCVDGYSPPVYSYYAQCFRCSKGTNNWPKYLAVSLLPTTAFLLAVSIIRFRATSPQLTGYLITCQIMTSPIFIRILKSSYHSNKEYGDLYISILSIWNLDFFRLFYEPFCLHPNATTLQVLSLDYIIAVYPLLLIILTYTLVRLHYNNCRLVVWLWRPFISCFAHCRRQWDIQNSLVDAFATFLLLSYVKFFSVSFDLLTPTLLWDSKARVVGTSLYYDGRIEYFGMDHIPYALMAISVLTVFSLFLILLLCLYPCRYFQRFLNSCHWNSQALHYFMDSFQGCFNDGTNGTRDCRFFSALYLLTRIAMQFSFIVTNNTFSTFFQTLILLALIALLACYQPYKKQLYTKLDILFLAMLCIIVNSVWKIHGKSFSFFINRLYFVFLPIPVIYPLYLIVQYILRKSAGVRAVLMDKLKKMCCYKEARSAEQDDTSPLLNF